MQLAPELVAGSLLWELYERGKRAIAATSTSPTDYERRLALFTKEMGL